MKSCSKMQSPVSSKPLPPYSKTLPLLYSLVSPQIIMHLLLQYGDVKISFCLSTIFIVG